VNDSFGHGAGDAVLRTIAERLRLITREEDTVARLGGDEFAVLLAGDHAGDRAAEVALRIVAAVGEPLVVNGSEFALGVSIGIASNGAERLHPTADEIVGNADLAMYRAKQAGKNPIEHFEPQMREVARHRLTLEAELRTALIENQFELHFQPVVTLSTGAIVGFEALVRWQHPTRGQIPPAEFIPIAEDSGLILPIGEWVLRAACREAAKWPKHLHVAINLSPVQFRHGDLAGLVHQVLLDTGLEPRRLELEITESVLIDNLPRALSILRRLKALGVRIAMDDFGTGYSSLSNLQAFPFDKIKIDRSFISNLERSAQAATIVRAVIGLGRGLNLPVVAEGVETQAQLAFLSDESCAEIQGYLLGKPLPIEQYAGLLGRAAAVEPKAANVA
jgi:diguanylate cyclase (GGDEF)-like protein